jgi:hypothetical protein
MAHVFVSWSGERSKALARALTEWLPPVFYNDLNVWMSEEDIQAGGRWELELAKQLEGTNFGIVCLTPDNIRSEWLIFEAGALSKAIEKSRVVPYRLGLKATDVAPPMSQFQGVDANEEGTLRLVISINSAIGKRIQDSHLSSQFEKWWPDLKEKLEKQSQQTFPEVRTTREMLEEILSLVRRTGSREMQYALWKILDDPNVHSIQVRQILKSGQSVGQVSFRIMVHNKKPIEKLSDDEIIPEQIYGMPTEVQQVKK